VHYVHKRLGAPPNHRGESLQSLRLRAGFEHDVEQRPPFRVIPRYVFGKHFKLAREAAEAPRYIRMQAYSLEGKTGVFRASFVLVGKLAALGCG
jgi:hypothetical protein